MRKSLMSVCFMALSMAACALATAAPAAIHAGNPVAEAYSAQAKSEPMVFTVASAKLEMVALTQRAVEAPAPARTCTVVESTQTAFASHMTGIGAESQGSIRHSDTAHAHAA